MQRSPGAVLVNIPDTTYFVRDNEMADLTRYTWVELGPVPGMPKWHEQSKLSRWPFPTREAARKFARFHKDQEPGRDVVIAYPDGSREGVL